MAAGREPRLFLSNRVRKSYYYQPQKGVGAWTADGNGQSYIQPGTKYVVGPNGQAEKKPISIIYSNGGLPTACTAPSGYCSWAQSDTGVSQRKNRTLDITEGFNWAPSSGLTVSGAFQYVHSTRTLRLTTSRPILERLPSGLDAKGNGLPVLNIPDAVSIASNPANYIWFASQDHIENHGGAELAGNFDAKYDVSDTGFLRAIRFGARYSNRTEVDDVSAYNWSELTPGWSTWEVR